MSLEPVPLLTADQLAAWLAISRTAAYRIEAGRIRLGGSVRWDRDGVQKWLDSQREGGEIKIALRHIRM